VRTTDVDGDFSFVEAKSVVHCTGIRSPHKFGKTTCTGALKMRIPDDTNPWPDSPGALEQDYTLNPKP
jgi:hypothetical protein